MSPAVFESYLEQLHAILLALSPAEDAGGGGSSPPPPDDGLGDATLPSASIRSFVPDFAALADFLFETLRKQFERLLHSAGAAGLTEEFQENSRKGFLVLLRCCMLVLRLLEFDPELVAGKIEILVGMLRALCALAQSLPSRSRAVKAVGPDGRNGNAEEGAKMPILAFFVSVIEVFINELLMHRQLRSSFSTGTRADVFSNSVTYIRDNQQVIDGQFREQSILIVKYIISSVLVEENGESTTCEAQNGSQHEIFYLLSVLKLMGSSLSQIIWILRQKGHTTSKEMVVSEILSCFRKFEENRYVKKIFLAITGSHPLKCKETILMIAHFASLLLYSFSRRLGLLWKSCILMIMTVLNLLFLEESNLDITLLPNTAQSGPQEDSTKVPTPRKSSAVIASNIQNIQKLYFLDDALSINYSSKRPAHVVSGESFLHILPCYKKNPSEWDADLIDFIGCTPGKNYAKWLKNLKAFKKSHYRNLTRKVLARARSNTVKTPAVMRCARNSSLRGGHIGGETCNVED